MSNEELAKRAVASPHWRWMPGMLIQTVGGPTDRIAGIDSTFIHAWAESQQTENPRGMWIRYRLDRMNKHGVPDLSDAATVGALLALVREAHAPAHWLTTAPLMTAGGVHGWRVQGLDGPVCATEAEALVTALEAAP